MPEAPEVQSVLESLAPALQDHRIEKVEIRHPKLAQNLPVLQFEAQLAGEHFRRFHRLGKYLVFELDHHDLISHLRMEGKWQLLKKLPEDPAQAKHIHAVFTLDDGRLLCYRDTRKFGRMQLYDKSVLKPEQDWRHLPAFDKIGLDVLDPALSGAYLAKKAARRKVPVKSWLLDQSVLAGIGNIYADEILFRAGNSPLQPVNTLTLEQLDALAKITREMIQQACLQGGTTIRTFESSPNHAGSFQNSLQVHTRQGQPCPVCQTPIECMRVGQRSTYYCPHCQNCPASPSPDPWEAENPQ